ncbi:hypothetical protein K8R61_00395 [bacterium]|nr:hypothetical protein [bacterium]
MLYSNEELNSFLVDKIKSEGFYNNYIFNSVKKESIEKTDNVDLYKMIIKTNISTR